MQCVHGLTGYDERQGAGEIIGAALRELSRVTEYDSDLSSMEGMLQEIDALINDFNRELSSYLDDMVFDDETFYETEKRLDILNGLKAKYGQTIEGILAYQEKQQKNWKSLPDMKKTSGS